MKALILMLVVFLLLLPVQAQYSGGSGTPDDPYQIATAADLIALGEMPGDYDERFILTADIDLDPNLPGRKVFDRAVIAPDTDPNDKYSQFQGTAFTGVFDGNGHKILHLSVKGRGYLGLFGRFGGADTPASEVTNLGVVDVNIVGTMGYIGGLAGENWGTVAHCYSTGAVSGGEYSVGGLVGENGGALGACFTTGAVSATGFRVGGLAGENRGLVIRCSSTGVVHGAKSAVGGLVGENCGDVTDCYSNSAVHGTVWVGGLVGSNRAYRDIWDGLAGTIANSYSSGVVTGQTDMGGLVGYNEAEIISSLWDTDTSGQSRMCGSHDIPATRCDEASGKTTAEMCRAGTFLAAGWDFVGETENGIEDIWWIAEGLDYPRLVRQLAAFFPNPPDGASGRIQPVILRWFPGAYARYHELYFGEDEEMVAGATPESLGTYRRLQATQTTSYHPGVLELAKTYFWRVDETEADGTVHKGPVWTFATADFFVVDDFESYNDDDHRVYETWVDGWTNGTGSIVGHTSGWSTMERGIVHGGEQCMPIYYYNNGRVPYGKGDAPYYSEAWRTWETPQDWTLDDADTLALYFHGCADNSRDRLYLALEDSAGRSAAVAYPDMDAVRAPAWREWDIRFTDFTGVNPTVVKKMCIGVGNRDNPQPGGTGLIYIDDIQLTKRTP
jgi:hypothetical protein